MAQYEQQPGITPEQTGAQPEHIASEHERLARHHERAVELLKESPEVESGARKEALEQSRATEKEQQPSASERQAVERRPLGKRHRDDTFRRTMSSVQADLSPASRTFSKIIHNKAVEKTSEALGSTIARPNAVLMGSMMAFVCTLGVYLIAKRYGYELSGFETIAAFIGGWLIGILFDFFRVMITGKR